MRYELSPGFTIELRTLAFEAFAFCGEGVRAGAGAVSCERAEPDCEMVPPAVTESRPLATGLGAGPR